jgi:hypothetical protein
MAGKRTHLSKIAEIKRLIGLGLKDRAIARALKVSRNTVAGARGGGESEDSQLVEKASGDEPLWCEKLDWERVRSEHEAGTDLTAGGRPGWFPTPAPSSHPACSFPAPGGRFYLGEPCAS